MSGSPKNVMVVEDDSEIREVLQTLLEMEGYAVTQAANGEEALRVLRAAGALPDLILLDIMMPVMDGYEFRAEQLKDARIAGIPTAVLSADGHILQKASQMGVTEALKKPLELEALLSLVKRCTA